MGFGEGLTLDLALLERIKSSPKSHSELEKEVGINSENPNGSGISRADLNVALSSLANEGYIRYEESTGKYHPVYDISCKLILA